MKENLMRRLTWKQFCAICSIADWVRMRGYAHTSGTGLLKKDRVASLIKRGLVVSAGNQWCYRSRRNKDGYILTTRGKEVYLQFLKDEKAGKFK